MQELKRMSEKEIKTMIMLHSEGKSTKNIGKILGFTTAAIRNRLAKNGLKSNRKTPKKLIIIDNKAICSQCGFEKSETEFANCYNKNIKYKRSVCHICHSENVQTNRSLSLQSYMKVKISRTKYTCKIQKIDFDLDWKWLIDQFNNNNGECFYSGKKMILSQRNGILSQCLSLDRVDPKKGYTKSNVVLCCYKMNAIKQDLTLDELKFWIPRMYEKIEKFLLLQNKNNI